MGSPNSVALALLHHLQLQPVVVLCFRSDLAGLHHLLDFIAAPLLCDQIGGVNDSGDSSLPSELLLH